MLRKLFLLIFLLLVATCVFADAPVEKRILSNGMTLITQEDHSKELVAICTFVDGGGRTEIPELSGLSHYFEHLIFRGGTTKQKELETRKKFLPLGTFYGYTSEDATCYYIVVPKENLPEALDRYSDVLMNLQLTSPKVDTERGIVLEEFSQSYFDIPSGMAYYNLYKTAFKKHSYGQTVIGDTAVVAHAPLQTFVDFYRERYTPDHLVMAAVGDFQTDELVIEIENTFGKFPQGNVNTELNQVEPAQNEFRLAICYMPISRVAFNLGFHIVSVSSPEFPTLEVLDRAMTDYSFGRLSRRLVQEEGLFANLYSWLDHTRDPGLWVIGGDVETGKMEEAFGALFAELSKIANEGLRLEEIEAAKGELIKDYQTSRESFFRRAETLCFYQLCSNLSLEKLYPNRINSVTAEDLFHQARRFLRYENATLSLVMPEGTNPPQGAQWQELFPVKSHQVTAGKKGIIPPQEMTLNNGVVLMMDKDQSSDMAFMEIFIRGGLWAEPVGKEGIADFLCRLLTRGTLEIPGEDFAQMLAKNGISLNATAEEDYCRISLNSTSTVFLQGLELTGLALTRPGLRDSDIESVRREKLVEIQGIGDQTYDLVRQEFNKSLYKNNPYKNPITGYEETVKKISSEDLKQFHQSLFCGRNIIVAVAGNFNEDEVWGMVNNLLGEIKPGMQFTYKPQTETVPSKPRVNIIDKLRAQTTYDMGWIAPPVNDEDYLPLTLAMRMLGSTMFFRFVYEEGICYRMWTRCTENIGPGKFWFETGISPDNYHFSQTEVLKEFKDFLQEPITNEMLSDAKKEAITKMKLNTETSADKAFALGKYYLLGFGSDYLIRYPRMINHLTAKEVKSAVDKYLKLEGYTLLVVGKISK